MPYVLALAIGWLANWLAQHVPSINPAQAHDVAQVLVDNFVGIGSTLLATGWYFFRRPGDTPQLPTSPAATATASKGWLSKWL